MTLPSGCVPAENAVQASAGSGGPTTWRPERGPTSFQRTNSVEFFGLFEQRGWSPRRFEALLVDLGTRLLVT